MHLFGGVCVCVYRSSTYFYRIPPLAVASSVSKYHPSSSSQIPTQTPRVNHWISNQGEVPNADQISINWPVYYLRATLIFIFYAILAGVLLKSYFDIYFLCYFFLFQVYSEISQACRPSRAYCLRSKQVSERYEVSGGVLAMNLIKQYTEIDILAYVSQVHKVVLPESLVDHETLTYDQIKGSIIRCPNPEYARKMIAASDAVRVRGDTVGGAVTCIVRNFPRVTLLSGSK